MILRANQDFFGNNSIAAKRPQIQLSELEERVLDLQWS